MHRKKKVKVDRVGFAAAIPLVFVVAFGTALANRIGATSVDFLIEVSEPLIEYIEDVLD